MTDCPVTYATTPALARLVEEFTPKETNALSACHSVRPRE